MTAEKVLKEFKFSFQDIEANSKKFLELKKAILISQKSLKLGDDVAAVFSFICDKAAEGKKLSVVEETELWSITQAAKELGVTRPTIYRMIERGDIEAVDFDGQKIVPSSVSSFLRRKEFARQEALKQLHEIDMKLKKETRELKSEIDNSENFEEIDL